MTDNLFSSGTNESTKTEGSLFEGNEATRPEETETTETQESSEPGILEQLVGEGKKFKSVDDLAKGKVEADKFIENLKKEMDEMRTELEKQDYAKELLESLKEGNTKKAADSGAATTPPKDPEGNTSTKGLSEDDVKDLVENYLTKKEQSRTAEQNVAFASEKLSEIYGEAARETIQTKARELGMTVESMEQMASQSPTAFLKLMDATGNTTPKPSDAIPNSQVNSTRLQDQAANNERNWAYYQKLLRENRKEYFKPHVQKQKYKDMERLGDKFFS